MRNCIRSFVFFVTLWFISSGNDEALYPLALILQPLSFSLQPFPMSWFTFNFHDFSYSFLSILFEGIPFLLLGSILSGFVDAFLPAKTMARFLPRNSGVAILASGLLGAIFPMCECGSVIVVRRLIKKGLPVSCAVTYMLAAPIVNPVVALSTFAAFRGQSPWVMASLRLSLGFFIAVAVGFVVRQIPAGALLRPELLAGMAGRRRTSFRIGAAPESGGELSDVVEGFVQTGRTRFLMAVQSAASDFLDVAFLLVIGAAFASIFNTAVDQTRIQPLASSPALSTVALMGLAFVLALCSTTDAFIAASLVAFPFVAKLAFLVFGAMFDIKLLFLYRSVFRRRFVIGLLVGLFVAVGLICVRLSVLNL